VASGLAVIRSRLDSGYSRLSGPRSCGKRFATTCGHKTVIRQEFLHSSDHFRESNWQFSIVSRAQRTALLPVSKLASLLLKSFFSSYCLSRLSEKEFAISASFQNAIRICNRNGMRRHIHQPKLIIFVPFYSSQGIPRRFACALSRIIAEQRSQ